MKFHKFLIGSIGILVVLVSIFGYLFLMVVAELIAIDYGLPSVFTIIFPLFILLIGIILSWYGFWENK